MGVSHHFLRIFRNCQNFHRMDNLLMKSLLVNPSRPHPYAQPNVKTAASVNLPDLCRSLNCFLYGNTDILMLQSPNGVI